MKITVGGAMAKDCVMVVEKDSGVLEKERVVASVMEVAKDGVMVVVGLEK